MVAIGRHLDPNWWPPFNLKWGVPRFINGLDSQLTPFVFVPDVELPTVWHPAGRGFVQVPFPGGDDRVAAAIHGFTTASVNAEGNLEILFNTQLDENQEPLKRRIDTSLGECRVLRFSPDGQWILMAGTTEIALVSMADSSVKKLDHDWDDLGKIVFSGDSRYVVVSHRQHVNLLDVAERAWIGEVTTTSPIICVSPFSSGAAVFSVEQSGRVAVTEFNSGEARTTLEASGPDLTTAAFTEAENCLVVALQSGDVAVLKVKNNPERIQNHATDIGAAQ